jgi:glycosyltransferase involved in cell wall biosynthesis
VIRLVKKRTPDRVLQLIPTLGHGGAERQLAYLCGELSNRGWEVHVASLAGGLFRERLIVGGVNLHIIGSRGNYDPRILLQIFRLVRDIEPRVVQTWLLMMDVLGGLAARVAGIPWILSERTSPDAMGLEARGLKWRLRARQARHAAAVISNSDGGDQYWARMVPAAVPRFVIRNALALEEIDAAKPADPERFGIAPDAPLLLSVGRFDEGKNMVGVIDAFERVIGRWPAVGLILGEGVQTDAAKRRIAEAGLRSRILTPGIVEGVFSWMKRASVFVSLSRFEGMPNAVMEAMAAGCPLVVSDIPAHRDILDDQAALWVSPEDPGAAAEAILSVLRDPDSARRRAALAQARAREWSISLLAEAHQRVYDHVTSAHSGGGRA